MIDKALEFIRQELNNFIKIKDKDFFNGKEVAVFVKHITQDGTLEFENGNVNDHNIIIFLVNLEEERLAEKHQFTTKKVGNQIQKQEPPIYLNLFVLFSAYSKGSYRAALKNLSFVISFFQKNRVFTQENFPQLNLEAQPWEKIDKLYFDLYNISLEQIYNLWSSIGAKSMPSVLYKMRLLMISEDNISSVSPGIEEAQLYDN